MHIPHLLLWHQLSSAILHWEPTPKVLGGDIGPVLHNNILLYAAHQAPEFLLYQLSGNHLKAEEVLWHVQITTIIIQAINRY